MCKIGDIIGVPKFIGQDGQEVSFHYFVVGQVDGDVLLGLLERISILDEQNKLTVNISNVIEKIEETVG